MLGGRDGFIEFSRQSLYPTRAFEKSSLPATHLTDDEALRVAQGTVGADMVAHVMQYARPERLKVVHALHDAGLAPKQISRATGLGQSFVYRALRDKRCHVGDTP
jgi:hypothetical protein